MSEVVTTPKEESFAEVFGLSTLLNMRQATAAVEHCLRSGPKNIPLLIGHTGVGKTTIVHGVAEALEYEMRIINLASASREDFTGIPFPNVKEGTFRFFSDGSIPTLAMPREEDRNRRVLLFLDEYNRCPKNVLSAVFQLMNGLLGSEKLGPNVRIVLAANPAGSVYSVQSASLTDPAFLRRVVVLPCHLTTSEFFQHTENHWDYDVVNYLREHPDQIQAPLTDVTSGRVFASPAGWHRVSELLQTQKAADGAADLDASQQSQRLRSGLAMSIGQQVLVSSLIAGVIGQRAADSFMQYLVDPDKQISASEILYEMHRSNSSARRKFDKLLEDKVYAGITVSLHNAAAMLIRELPALDDVLPSLRVVASLVPASTWETFQSATNNLARENHVDDMVKYHQVRAYVYDLNTKLVSKEMADKLRKARETAKTIK